MNYYGAYFANNGLILRSGGAEGADRAFEEGCDRANGDKEIWRPASDFKQVPHYRYPTKQHFDLASKYHPIWDRLPEWTKSLHARNVGQILGSDCKTPALFVVCYTKDGCEHDRSRTKDTGGTGMAISIASLCGVPVFNLKNEDAPIRLTAFIERLKNE